MDAKELRIGNLVKNEHGVVAVNESWFLFNVWKTLNPIPLTKEWLLKFGLNCNGIIYEQEKNSKFAVKLWEVGKPGQFLIFWGDNRLSCVEPVYVHQLQNLYFALTGEELTIKS